MNVTITGNKGVDGGGLQVLCSGVNVCKTELFNVSFAYNTATTKGGAIYYDLYRPEMTNVTFLNNTAPHGNHIASYPVKIVQAFTNSTKIALNDVASGQENDYEIKLSVVDHDNQISSLTSGGRITISSLNEKANVLGSTSASIVEGIATFNGTIFVAPPGSSGVQFKLSSGTINTSKLLKQYGKLS